MGGLSDLGCGVGGVFVGEAMNSEPEAGSSETFKQLDMVNGVPVVVEVRKKKVCKTCKEEKWREEFHRNRSAKDGVQSSCKACSKQRIRDMRSGAIPARVRVEELRNERQKKIAHMLIDNPRVTMEELARETGVTINTVAAYMAQAKILKALRHVGAQEVTRMIPRALKAYSEILDQTVNVSERNKVATKVLESEKIIGPNRVEIGIRDMASESTERLRQMIKEAKEFPDQVITEAEVVE